MIFTFSWEYYISIKTGLQREEKQVKRMRITEVAVGYIGIPLVTPFKTALRTVDNIQDLIVRVTLESGEVGYGEAPPTAVITGETRQSIETAVREYLAPAVTGVTLDSPEDAWKRMEKAMAKNTTAKAAMDVAIWDACARAAGKPLFRMLGGGGEAPKTRLETDITISVNDPETMARDTERAVKEGFRILKVKVGKGGLEDVERVRRVRAAAGKDAVLRIDANQGWTPEEAVRTIGMMEDAGLNPELVEQPVSCHDFRGMQWVTSRVSIPILADESVFSPEDAERLIQERGADMINIKLMKTGGITPALRICDMAAEHRISCMMGCMLESAVSVSGAAHLAAASPVVTMCDLDGPSLCAENPYEGGPIYAGPWIDLTETPGVGITGMPVRFEKV